MDQEKILVWLPSPMGDAILCTPALRAIRRRFESKRIYFLARPTVKQLLSPSNFNDEWIETSRQNVFQLAKMLKSYKFSTAVLFKNSFGSGLAALLAGIPQRIGYARDARSFFLTKKIKPPKDPRGRYKPLSMIEYYLAITSWLGCETDDIKLELLLEPKDAANLSGKMPRIFSPASFFVIMVPGGAFGPSKCWPPERFAAVADWLIEKHGATVAVSVSPDEAEIRIADKICTTAKNKLYSLAEIPLTLGELKTFIAEADLVITNDTGPRHIAIALGKKVISLFGPNNPDWTQTGYKEEIQIVGTAECVPCEKPQCTQKEHKCMNSITVEMVCQAAERMLTRNQDEI
jgi:heptosyltransferase-2